MIRSLLLSLLLIPLLSAAQYKYSASLGGSHERLNDAFGNHARLYYNFSDNFRMNTEFVRYYEVKETEDGVTKGYDYRELNVNINYAILFGEEQKFGFYGVLGFTYNYGKKGFENSEGTTITFVESAGMNFGFGAFYKLGRFMPYVESRNVSSGSSNYLIFSAGLAYSWGKQE